MIQQQSEECKNSTHEMKQMCSDVIVHLQENHYMNLSCWHDEQVASVSQVEGPPWEQV